MLIDGEQLARDGGARDGLEADICVVGAGAAGITLAHRLRGAGRSVLLLEAGGLEFRPADAARYRGAVSGNLADPAYLHRTRLGFFGGTTNHWSGHCRPLDPFDLQARPWLDAPAWPLAWAELAPWYRDAADYCQVDRFTFDDAARLTRLEPPQTALAGALLRPKFFHRSAVRFGQTYRADLAEAASVRVVTDCVLRSVRLRDRRVSALGAVLPGGRELAVRAGVVVLAMGAIENARLLLANREDRPTGIGNESDAVGRYFMDHPWGLAGYLVSPLAPTRFAAFTLEGDEGAGRPGRPAKVVLGPSDDTQRRQQIGNFYVMGNALPDAEPIAAHLERLGTGYLDPEPLCTVSGGDRSWEALYVSLEMAPRAANRVTLLDERDALGLPRAHLTVSTGTLDDRTLDRAVRLVAREAGRRRAGRVVTVAAPLPEWGTRQVASHHLGTCRMGDDPASSVADRTGRLHSVDNLYVAGSALFPSGGASNPTLTIVALAARLAHHLAERSHG